MKQAGILPIYRVEESALRRIKQSLLLFDTVGVPHLQSNLEQWDTAHSLNCQHRPIINALIGLAETEFVFDPMPLSSLTVEPNRNTRTLQELVDRIYQLLHEKAEPEPLMDTLARLNAMALNNAYPPKDFTSVPIVDLANSVATDDDRSSDVLQLVIANMPIPDVDTSLGRILDFKREKANDVHLRGLRLWMHKAASSKEPHNVLEEELEYLLTLYSECMRLHEIKQSRTRLQAIVITGAEWLENIANRQFSKAAKAIFSINEAKIALAQAELTSPGREVAYMYSAHRVFS